MKKKVIILIGLLMSLSLSACGSSGTAASKGDETKAEDTQQETTEGDQEKDDEESEALEETQEEPTESAEEEENETIYNIGDSASLKDWEISVTDMQVVDSISAKYVSFSPDEDGNKFIQVFVTVVNNGKQADRFLPMVGFGDDVSTKIFFGDGYEFNSTNLLGYDNEMHDSTLNPLSSKSGEIVFEVPEAVSGSEDELLIQFKADSDTLKFKIR